MLSPSLSKDTSKLMVNISHCYSSCCMMWWMIPVFQFHSFGGSEVCNKANLWEKIKKQSQRLKSCVKRPKNGTKGLLKLFCFPKNNRHCTADVGHQILYWYWSTNCYWGCCCSDCRKSCLLFTRLQWHHKRQRWLRRVSHPVTDSRGYSTPTFSLTQSIMGNMTQTSAQCLCNGAKLHPDL